VVSTRKVNEVNIDEDIAFDVLEAVLEAGKSGIRMGKLVDEVCHKDTLRRDKNRKPSDVLVKTADVLIFWVEQEELIVKKGKKEDSEIFYLINPEKIGEARSILKRALGI